VARRRAQWKKFQGRPDPARLVFVDETWAKTNMAPLRGWAPVGQRLHAKVPYGRWKTMTFIAALRCDRIDAPFVFDQPINGASFTQWVEEQLCPTLRPGDIVILDNLSSHKKPAVRAAIRARGARLLFLPPYRPRFQPDQTGIRQAQAPTAQKRRADTGGHMATDRILARRLLPTGVRQLPQELRICVNVMSSDSSCHAPSP
jgi:DDE superfamily endonuclease